MHSSIASSSVNLLLLLLLLLLLSLLLLLLLRATRGARNPNLQVVFTHASHASMYSQHSFGHPLRMNGMNRTQFDHARLDLLSLLT